MASSPRAGARALVAAVGALPWAVACGTPSTPPEGHTAAGAGLGGSVAGSSMSPAGMAGSVGGSAATAGGGGTSGGAGGTSGAGAGMSGAGTQGGLGGAGQGGASGAGAGGDTGGAGAPQSGGAGGGTAGTSTAGGASGGDGQGGSVGGAGSAGAGSGAAGMGGSGPSRPARVLLYSFSTLDIPSVPAQLDVLADRLEALDYEVERSEDPGAFTDDNLARYAAVGMINTCFYPFGANQSGVPQSEALQRFLQQGGGLFGTHCADVTFQSANPPALYNQLIGGRASSSNFDGVSNCRTTGEHATTAELPATFEYSGNLDATDFIKDDSVVLVKCRWDRGNGEDVAVSWVRMEGAGRVFFTNFAKVDADLTHPTLGAAHIIRGLTWVLGL